MTDREIRREETLAGPTIFYTVKDTTLSMTINSGGIYFEDGKGEIVIEIGETGPMGNDPYIRDVEGLADREVDLIFEIAKYQYHNFKATERHEEF